MDALLRQAKSEETAGLEAVELLGQIVDLAPDDATAVPAALRRGRLLEQLGHLDQADQVMDEIAARVEGSRRWEPVILTRRIESLLARGDRDRARALLDSAAAAHPDYGLEERFEAALVDPSTEELK